MQKSPAQVAIWTQASCRIRTGMSEMQARISRTPLASPAPSAFIRRNASGSSGGYSRVVRIVIITQTNSTAAPM